jgi:hypothetical protein
MEMHVQLKTFGRGALAAAVALLVACGGGGEGGGGTPGGGDGGGGQVTGSQSGILTDARIEGVRYTTSSGVTGVTDADGRYAYNPGDTVTFSVGSVVLGEVPATGIITPIQLAAGSEVKLGNLLVVLQSLDGDGNPDNGINIPAASASALTASIDLGAALTGSATTSLQGAMTAGGITSPIKTAAESKQHFIDQATTLLASNVWVGRDESGKPLFAIHMQPDGTYLMGEASPADDAGMPGYERGKVTVTDVNTKGFTWSSSITADTNGEWGLSNPLSGEYFNVNGDALIVVDPEETTAIAKADNDPAGIVGAWQPVGPADHVLIVFQANGYFLFVDAVGETMTPDIPEAEWCGTGGMELGRYTWNATSKVLTPSALEVNTNGCVGFFEETPSGNPTTHTIEVSADGKTAVWTGSDGGDPWHVNLVRVSK